MAGSRSATLGMLQNMGMQKVRDESRAPPLFIVFSYMP